MFHRYRLLALAVSASLLGHATSATAQTKVEDAPDPYVHKVAGVEFPAQADEFRRGNIYEYDEQGSDASVGYASLEIPGEMTVYLYPLGASNCAELFDGADNAILERGGAIRSFAAGISVPEFSGATQISRSYSVPANSYGFDHPDLVSYLWVGCPLGGQWIVKYRGSFWASDEEKVDGLAQSLFGKIDWSRLTGGKKLKVK